MSAGIAQIYAVIDASTYDSAIRQLHPVAGAHDSGIARAHKQGAVGIAAERKVRFEFIHSGDGALALIKEWRCVAVNIYSTAHGERFQGSASFR